MSAFSLTGIWGFSSSDEDMEARTEDLAVHIGEDKSTVMSMGHRKAVFLENLTDDIFNAKKDKPWTPPEDFWRIAKQEPLISNCGDVPGREESKSGVILRHTVMRTDPSIQGEIKHSDLAESHPQGCRPCDLGLAGATGSELWRAESLESICSSGISLSLAERVEINRTILRQRLQKTQKKSSEGQQAAINDQRMENTHSRGTAYLSLLKDIKIHMDFIISQKNGSAVRQDLVSDYCVFYFTLDQWHQIKLNLFTQFPFYKNQVIK